MGKAPSTAKNRTDTTFFLCHAALTVSVRRWRESVVVLPGRPKVCGWEEIVRFHHVGELLRDDGGG